MLAIMAKYVINIFLMVIAVTFHTVEKLSFMGC